MSRRWWLRLGQLALTVVVTAFILRAVGVGLDEVRALGGLAWRPQLLPLAGASALLLGGYALSALLWGRMVRELGGPGLRSLEAARIYMVSNLGRYVPGKVWAFAGMALLARRAGVTPPVAAGAALLGQGVALGGAALMGVPALLGAGGGFRWVGIGALAGLALVVGGSAVPSLFQPAVRLAFRMVRQPPPVGLLGDRTFGLRWILLYAANWGVYAAAFWGLARSLGMPVTLLEAGSAFAAAYLLGFLAVFAPAGIGVREGFLVALLPGGGGGALAVALVARVWTTLVEVVPAGLLALLAGPRKGQRGEGAARGSGEVAG